MKHLLIFNTIYFVFVKTITFVKPFKNHVVFLLGLTKKNTLKTFVLSVFDISLVVRETGLEPARLPAGT